MGVGLKFSKSKRLRGCNIAHARTRLSRREETVPLSCTTSSASCSLPLAPARACTCTRRLPPVTMRHELPDAY